MSKALRRSDSKSEKVAPTVRSSSDKNDSADHEEYFGAKSSKEPGQAFPNSHCEKMNQQENEDNYANTGPNITSTVSSSGKKSKVGPEPPPRVDRAKKPSRFRSAHERLFGRFTASKNEPTSRYSYDAPDYINTATITAAVATAEKTLNGKTGLSYIDNSSLSSDSYNKYGSPPNTLEGKNRNELSNGNRRTHDPYRFTKISGQPGTPKSNASLERKPSSAFPSPTKVFPADAMVSSASLKPPNYQSVYVTGSTITNTTDLNVNRLTDGRPVPPPKPSNYSSSRARKDIEEIGYGQTKPSTPLTTLYGPPSKRASTSNAKELTGGPPGYFQSAKESPRAPKVPPPSIHELAYSTHSTFTSRR